MFFSISYSGVLLRFTVELTWTVYSNKRLTFPSIFFLLLCNRSLQSSEKIWFVYIKWEIKIQRHTWKCLRECYQVFCTCKL